MSLGDFAAGLFGLAVIAGASGFAAWRTRRVLLPDWWGPAARLAEIVVALALVLLVAEALGAVGGFRRVGLIVGVVVVAALVVAAARWFARSAWRPSVQSTASRATRPWAEMAGRDPLFAAIALALATLAVVIWVARSLDAYDVGVFDVDSLQYHLPFAARFFQTGSLTELHFVMSDPVHAFHPLNSEALHAIGMALFRSDLLSPGLNVGWLVVALLAGWVAGERSGAAPLTLAGTALVVILPLLVRTNAGSAGSDIAALAMLLAAVALLLRDPDRPAAALVAAAAAGLAIGSKLSVVAPIAALTIIVMLRWRARPPVAIGWCAVVVVTGGFWYLRNLVRTGSPVPPLDLGVGPIYLPSPDLPFIERFGHSVADYAFDGDAWSSVFLPGLAEAFGSVTVPLLALVAAGLVLGLVRRVPGARLAGAVALVGVLAYAATPLSAQGPEGDPVELFFALNIRYVLPVIPLALIALALGATGAPRWLQGGLLGAFAVSALIAWGNGTELDFRSNPTQNEALPLVVGAVVAVIVLGLARRRGSASLAAAIAVVGAALLIGGWRFAERFADVRYATISPPELRGWIEATDDHRIGVNGYFDHYRLLGSDLDNHVAEIGFSRPRGGFEHPADCTGFRRLVNDRGYDFLVIGTLHQEGSGDPPALAWTRSDASATTIVQHPLQSQSVAPIWVFSVDSRLHPDRCPGSARESPA